MFADPVSNLMLVILIFFIGLLVMFLFIMRSLEHNEKNVLETHRQLAMGLTDLERKVAQLALSMKKQEKNAPAEDRRQNTAKALTENTNLELAPSPEPRKNK